jgi:hypothetical protein
MLKFLIILLCVFFLIRILGRMFVVSTFNNLNKKMTDEMKRRQDQMSPQHPAGHVSVNQNKPGNNKNRNDGDYVDYEEVK